MLPLTICILVGLPQIVAGSFGKGPAAHLTLLLLSVCAITTVLTVLSLPVSPRPTTPQDALPLLVWPVLGLCLLAPFYWAVEHTCSEYDFEIEVVLVQALTLTFAAALWGDAHHATPSAIATGAVVLILTLGIRGSWLIMKPRGQK